MIPPFKQTGWKMPKIEWYWRLVVVAAASVLCLCSLVSREAKAVYDVKSGEASGRPGSIIRVWPLEGGGPSGAHSTAFRILYRSEASRQNTSWPAEIAKIKITKKMTRKIKNRILEICAAPAATPVKPSAPATSEINRQMSAHFRSVMPPPSVPEFMQPARDLISARAPAPVPILQEWFAQSRSQHKWQED
jgi:hypothetical protein